MNLKKIITVGITAAIAVSTIAVTALTYVSGYSKPYKPGYSYTVTNNSYVKMTYHESGNFVQTVATNKKSTRTFTRIGIFVYKNNGNIVNYSYPFKNLDKKGGSGYVGAIGSYNFRSSGATNYKHKVDIFSDINHSNLISTISRTVG